MLCYSPLTEQRLKYLPQVTLIVSARDNIWTHYFFPDNKPQNLSMACSLLYQPIILLLLFIFFSQTAGLYMHLIKERKSRHQYYLVLVKFKFCYISTALWTLIKNRTLLPSCTYQIYSVVIHPSIQNILVEYILYARHSISCRNYFSSEYC